MPASKRPNILIVDDRKENLFAMTDLLRDEKLTIFTATSGNEALTLMLRHEFAVVLMDVMMPEMDGFETVDLMFTNEAIRDTPVIFLTAINKEDQHIYKGYAAGAVDYIFKPFNPEILKSKVRVFVKLFQAMEERQRLMSEMNKIENLARLGTLAGGIAHDFNNLFSVIIGSIEVALGDIIHLPEPTEDLQRALLASKMATALTRRLITLTQGGFLHLKPMPIAATIRESIDQALENSGSTCRYSLADDLFDVAIDHSQISQVFHNLAINAAESMPGGGLVEVRAKNLTDRLLLPDGFKPGNSIQIDIEDHGTGIAPEHLGKIFDPYFSTKERGSQKGMGLGLSVVHSITAKHGGQVSVHATSHEGTCMRIILPALTTGNEG
jgi:two-component system sensor histidine kinase/response regulator